MDNSSPRERLLDHLDYLIDEGRRVAALERPSSYRPYIQGDDKIPLHAWLTQVKNIVAQVFGAEGQHFRHLADLTEDTVEHSYEVLPIVGLLEACKRDLEGGFLRSQEVLLAGELFDSVIEQADHLLKVGHKDPAAVLGRVVLEDTLRRIADNEGLDSSLKASRLNDEIKKAGRYAQPQWRLVQTWLDIGNAAAHGDFDDYTGDEVGRMLDDIRHFIAREHSPRP